MRAFVLSGGAGFGAYQVGAWQALVDCDWHPDVVVGTSIGSVNAFVIAHGATRRELHDAWVRTPGELRTTDGALPFTRDIARFREWTARLVREFGERPLQCHLQVCMAAVPNGQMRVVEGTTVTERHLLAACALPPVMLPVRVDGRLYMDGGVFYHVALKEAVATGADDIIVIDVLRSTPAPTVRMLRLTLLQVRNWLRQETHQPASGDLARVRLRYIGPSSPLGTLRECWEWDPRRTERMIDAGYCDTMAALNSAVASPVRL